MRARAAGRGECFPRDPQSCPSRSALGAREGSLWDAGSGSSRDGYFKERDLAKVFLGLWVVLVHPKIFIEPLFYMTVLDGGGP